MSIMAKMTGDEKSAYRAKKVKESRDYHRELIDRLGIKDADFNIKTPEIKPEGKLLWFFENEFLKDKGFYFELVDTDLNPTDPERKVYKLSSNPNYQEEYQMVKYARDGKEFIKYLVPFDELRCVDLQSVIISKAAAVTSSDEILSQNKQKTFSSTQNISVSLEDAPYTEMTIRDYIAIHTGRPVSQKKWLNELVKISK